MYPKLMTGCRLRKPDFTFRDIGATYNNVMIGIWIKNETPKPETKISNLCVKKHVLLIK
jgi:hypothetical protein